MKKLRVGVIGCGRISPFHGMPAKSQELVKLVACCDVKREAARERAALFGCKAYTDFEEMIQKEKLDVVHICLPHYLHSPVAIRAMELGCHVLTEKPMAISYKQAQEMVKASKKFGKSLGVIFQNRYNAGSVLARKALSSGSLGKILAARCIVNWCRTPEYYSSSDWKGTWDKEGGGCIIDQAIHTIDLMCWLIGYGEKGANLKSVDASLANRYHQGICEVEDCADGIIQFKSGVIASFWCMNYFNRDEQVEIQITCEKGEVKITGEEAQLTYYDGRELTARPNPNETFDYGGGPSYWGASHAKQIDQFYKALAENETPEISGELILNTTHKMIMAMYDSGKKNKPVVF